MEPLKDRIEEAGFDYVNGLICERNFPTPASVDITGFKLVPATERMATMESVATKEVKGAWRGATIDELIEWRRLHGEELPKACYVIAPGTVWQNSGKGKKRVPFVSYADEGFFTLSMGFLDSGMRGASEFLLVMPK